MSIVLDANLVFFFLFSVVAIMVVQVYMLTRVRNVLQAISMNFDSVIYFVRKLANNSAQAQAVASRQEVCKTCQMCRHRLAYINTSKTTDEEEVFFFKCALLDKNITLDDSCDNFEADPESDGDC
ncbi:MAG: hypothetical protein KDI06_17310 [Calditrichaeota bacterium]|nr:hypothetical protein [Calditrichota bacterium]HQU71611.1 hypothetical protein [Calditrichia bacterium]